MRAGSIIASSFGWFNRDLAADEQAALRPHHAALGGKASAVDCVPQGTNAQRIIKLIPCTNDWNKNVPMKIGKYHGSNDWNTTTLSQ